MAKKKRARKKPRTTSLVLIHLPERPLKYADAIFIVRSGGQKVGELRVSQGGIDWYPRSAKHAISKSWRQFAQLLGEER